ARRVQDTTAWSPAAPGDGIAMALAQFLRRSVSDALRLRPDKPLLFARVRRSRPPRHTSPTRAWAVCGAPERAHGEAARRRRPAGLAQATAKAIMAGQFHNRPH